MRRNWIAFLIFALAAGAAAADGTDSLCSFTVPDGWKVTLKDHGVEVSHGNSSFAVWVVRFAHAKPPGALLTQIRPQLEKQSEQFHETESGQTRFGGQPAAFFVYSWIPPSGVRSIRRVVTMTVAGTLNYIAFEETSEVEAQTVIPELARIEQSFAAADGTDLLCSFTVPDGWKVTLQNDGVGVSHGKSSFAVWVVRSAQAKSPGAFLTQIRPQLERQTEQFHETESGQTRFGGLPAAFFVDSGIPPSGVPSVRRVVATTNGTLSYIAFESASLAEAQTAMAELARIEQSFAPASQR